MSVGEVQKMLVGRSCAKNHVLVVDVAGEGVLVQDIEDPCLE